MQFASTGHQASQTSAAILEAAREVERQLAGAPPDLAFVFTTPHHALEPGLGRQIRSALGARVLLGCTAETVVANEREYENQPTLAIWAACLPGCQINPFHVAFERTQDGLLATGAPSSEDGHQSSRAAFLLGDPFSCSVDSVLSHFAAEFPNLPVIGGMASGASSPGENRLYFNDGEYDHGGVGVVIQGPVSIRTVVSQGCRPIGTPFVVTKSHRNMLIELGGRPALEQLNMVYRQASSKEQSLIQRGIHLGVAMNASKCEIGRGDFLISNVIGADRDNGAIALGSLVRTGHTVQFHVRDATTADEDLQTLITDSLSPGPCLGGLLFSCNGRGTRMFPAADHDVGVISRVAGKIPLAGFFAMGELGPIAGQNYIHGYTASLALFGPEV